jgi:hypothetical protein
MRVKGSEDPGKKQGHKEFHAKGNWVRCMDCLKRVDRM